MSHHVPLFQSPYSWTLAQCEIPSAWKEQQLDSLSTWCNASLAPFYGQIMTSESKFPWGVTERIMDNFRLIWKKPLSAPCLPAARQTLRCGKTRAAKECLQIRMRAAGCAIITPTVQRMPAHPNSHPLSALVDHTSSVRLGHSHTNRRSS